MAKTVLEQNRALAALMREADRRGVSYGRLVAATTPAQRAELTRRAAGRKRRTGRRRRGGAG